MSNRVLSQADSKLGGAGAGHQQINRNFDVDDFLQNYWQKKPLLLPALFPDFTDLIDPQQLAGLAGEADCESRLVTESSSGSWELQHGPFDAEQFAKLPTSHWTLLVQAVDQWSEQVQALKRAFDFLPSWRIEDVMVSYATPQGGIGPHFDYYDVFLVQGQGQRRWRVGGRCTSATPLKSGSELGILQSFSALEEFVLEPGDALYLPPQYAHWGTALSDSLCYSIGFRAASLAEMLEGFSDSLIARADPANRFVDGKPQLPERLGEIDRQSLQAAFEQMQKQLSNLGAFESWFGCHVTAPKYPELIQPLPAEVGSEQLEKMVGEGLQLSRNPSSRFAFSQSDEAAVLLFFADGVAHELARDSLQVVSEICELTTLNSEVIAKCMPRDELLNLLLTLLNQGSLLGD